jgi:hypothetical protein
MTGWCRRPHSGGAGLFHLPCHRAARQLSAWCPLSLGSTHFLSSSFFPALQVVRNQFWRVFEEQGVDRSRVGAPTRLSSFLA